MENTQSVFDAKVTIRGTLHTLTSIKELLGQSVNERRRTRFSSTVFGKWLDFLAYSNDNLLLNFIFQHEIPKVDTFKGLQNSSFCDRVFPDKIAEPLKKVRVSDLLELIRKPKKWSALFDEDSVKVCLLLVSNIVFMGRESKNYIADNLIELVDDLSAWDAYPWGEYFWRALYRRLVNVISRHKDAVMLKNKKNVSLTKKTKKIDSSKKIETYNVYGFVWSLKIYILEMYRNSNFWWKKDPLVIPCGLAWSKIGNFKKGDYGALFANDGQPNGPITASPEGIQPIICVAVVHDAQFEQQPKELLKNVGDGDPSIILKELAIVKQRMNAIERFIKSRNDNLSEDLVAKQSVEKEIESFDGKADSAISNVIIGEISCQNLVKEQLQSRNMCIQSITNQFVQHPLESPKGKVRFCKPTNYHITV
ncbi:phospholipase-like protein [Tanacetum coccineum]